MLLLVHRTYAFIAMFSALLILCALPTIVRSQEAGKEQVQTITETTPSLVGLYPIEGVPGGGEAIGDFVVGPGKVDITIEPGETNVTEMIVTNRTGSYPLSMLAITVHYNSFVYPGAPGPLVANPLWFTTATNPIADPVASFNLGTITFVDEIPGISLTLTGTGLAKLTGFDDTVGTWSFTATQSGTVFGWDSINVSRVPDGGTTVVLLGLSVLGLGSVNRFLPSLKK